MKKIIIIIEAIAILALIGVILHGKPSKPQIIRETETVTRYIKEQPADMSGFIAAWNSPLNITGVMRNDWIDVTATDGYKAADKSFRVGLPDPGYRNMIIGGLSYRVPSGPGAWCMYYRFIIPRVGVGGGCAVDPTGAAVMAGAAWMW